MRRWGKRFRGGNIRPIQKIKGLPYRANPLIDIVRRLFQTFHEFTVVGSVGSVLQILVEIFLCLGFLSFVCGPKTIASPGSCLDRINTRSHHGHVEKESVFAQDPQKENVHVRFGNALEYNIWASRQWSGVEDIAQLEFASQAWRPEFSPQNPCF